MDWNVVVSVAEHRYKQARELLQRYGAVAKTEFYNVLVMRVDDGPRLLELLNTRVEQDPEIGDLISRVAPVSRTFVFQTPEEFEIKAKEAALPWVPELGGRSFHVRMHRRGFKGRLSSQDEERFLDACLLDHLEQMGDPGRISFEDPDAILALETISQRAGLSLWTREELKRYPLLKLD